MSDLMTPAEAAELLRCSVKTLANQRSRGEGVPYLRLPTGGIRYRGEVIAAVLEECAVFPGAADSITAPRLIQRA